MKVKAGTFDVAVSLELEGFAEEIRAGLAEEVEHVSTQCVKQLRGTSPKRTGSYAKGWTKKLSKTKHSVTASVYNKAKPSLTHLLENGHQKAKGGRVEGVAHIKPAEDAAANSLLTGAERLVRGASS